MSSLSIAKSRNLESTAPKKGSAKSNTSSRRKVPSIAATAKKPPRSVDSKAERVAAGKTLVKIDKPKVERVTKQERVLTLLSQPAGASIAEMMRHFVASITALSSANTGHGTAYLVVDIK